MNWGDIQKYGIALVLLAVAIAIFYLITVIIAIKKLLRTDYKTQKTFYWILLTLIILNCTIIGNVVAGVPFFALIYFTYIYEPKSSQKQIKNN